MRTKRLVRVGRNAVLAPLAATLLCMALAPMANATPQPSGGGTSESATVPTGGAKERFRTIDRRNAQVPAQKFDRLDSVAKAKGRVHVIVGLRTLFTPEGALREARAGTQRAAIARARGALLGALAGTDFSVIRTYDTVPYVALSLPGAALTALRDSGQAASVQEDVPELPALAESTKLVEAQEAWTFGRGGAGQTIAILDSGVDGTHPFLRNGGRSKVVFEACYSFQGDCPDGTDTSTAPGSGAPCAWAPMICRHGTHVAGIAAGRGSQFSGVARSADLISIQVFSKLDDPLCEEIFQENPCIHSYRSDSLAALEHVYALRSNFQIAAVNMSFGGGFYDSHCDADDERTAAIENLRSVDIATVASVGNNSSRTYIGAPACVSSVISVGSTSKIGQVDPRSNYTDLVSLMAPGVGITSSVTGGGFAAFSGTSMAAPHVAGAWAVMKQVDPSASVQQILDDLTGTGKRVTDSGTGVTKPRIRVLSASVLAADTGFRSDDRFTYQGGDVASDGVGLALRVGQPATGSIFLGGVPRGAVVRQAYLFWMTVGGPDNTAVFRGRTRTGTLVGASRSCSPDLTGANRVYRATIPTREVPGDGEYVVSGVGGSEGVDGQGASLVVIFSVAGSPVTGRIVLRKGAMTLHSWEKPMRHTFTGLVIPRTPTQAFLNVGMGDGQAGPEGPMLFGGDDLSGQNFFGGDDGGMWDDSAMFVPSYLLRAGTTSQTNEIAMPFTDDADCLAWAYAALAYQY